MVIGNKASSGVTVAVHVYGVLIFPINGNSNEHSIDIPQGGKGNTVPVISPVEATKTSTENIVAPHPYCADRMFLFHQYQYSY